MAAESYSKSGDFVPPKTDFSSGEFVTLLRATFVETIAEVGATRIYVAIMSPNGTRANHFPISFEEMPVILRPGYDLSYLEVTIGSPQTGACHLTGSFRETGWYIGLDGQDIGTVNSLWSNLLLKFGLTHEQGAQKNGPAAMPPSLDPTKLHVSCKAKDITWPAIVELPTVLGRYGFEVVRKSVTIRRYPTVVHFASLEGALRDVEQKGIPSRYEIWLYSRDNGTFMVSQFRTVHGDECLDVEFSGPSPEKAIGGILPFLGLEPDNRVSPQRSLPRTCFIAYRFNEEGHKLADTLEKFLRLLEFDVATGRMFSPGPISEKVKARMAQQAIVFAILTAGQDKTWLVQESLIANLGGKPLFLLKERTFEHSAGLLADHEYIDFESPHIEKTFIAILEGLRGLGFADSLASYGGHWRITV